MRVAPRLRGHASAVGAVRQPGVRLAAAGGNTMANGFQLGDLTIHRIIEEERPLFDPLTFFPTLTKEVRAENLPWLQPDSIDPATGQLRLCIQSYVVQTPHHTIL